MLKSPAARVKKRNNGERILFLLILLEFTNLQLDVDLYILFPRFDFKRDRRVGVVEVESEKSFKTRLVFRHQRGRYQSLRLRGCSLY